MPVLKKIRVLVVDDSHLYREVLSKGISTDPYIEVVAMAVDPFDARDKILKYKPDVMTCDIEMPKMNGIEFLKRLLPQYPIPVIVVSGVSESVFEAMNAGAVDFVTKPDVQSVKGIEKFLGDLIIKIRIASKAKIGEIESSNITDIVSEQNTDTGRIIAIGASTGGTEALYNILKAMPVTAPGIVVVQHIPPVFSRMFAERLDKQTHLRVKEAQPGDFVEQGKVIIAPGDQQMKVIKVGKRYNIELGGKEKVNGHCPSVDVLFESVAKAAGNKAVGIILTGMGYDGAKGLLAMKRKGARTIGQDEKSSVVYGMPKVAFDIGAVEKQTSLEKIPQLIFSMLK
ncbi:two-component system chemotaxis response regulator CheB [Ruminiclostridium sufflavum DSM 19573]|uniref:Protein-glutamate methylesterase/protein-glutamine glutaminase n=1 Tax=Ruminiclostridium sufflavum DSM 19573 TaxID=1121337 RepID=A0A318XS20_9FIRM|nr:chemotaxis response regulator protein-glutamate methylesterase [Ruminiclostridium sufflavum]PYG84350.1 two-component system chemotaxis response regulator CheB [Ruminiclostridium sufflavum DSM 19573]